MMACRFYMKLVAKNLTFWFQFAKEFNGAIGSRVMGGGFGGCTISLVETDKEQDFIEQSSNKFKAEFGYLPVVHEVKISSGARKIM